MKDLIKLLENLGDKEKKTLVEIALSMARNRQESWTGVTVWSFHTSQGAIGDATERRERSLFRRAVRSKGVSR